MPDMQANMLHQIEIDQASRRHDVAEIQRLKDYLIEVDPEGELRFTGRSVIDWALDLISRKLNV